MGGGKGEWEITGEMWQHMTSSAWGSAGDQTLQTAASTAAARQDMATTTPGLPGTKSGHSCPKVRSSNRREPTVKDAALTCRYVYNTSQGLIFVTPWQGLVKFQGVTNKLPLVLSLVSEGKTSVSRHCRSSLSNPS